MLRRCFLSKSGAVMGVGEMALCRESCCTGLAGSAGGVGGATGQARALCVCVEYIFRMIG